MKMEVSIISVESIKPSLASTHHLEPLKLSVLDQLCYSTSIPFVFFYPNPSSNSSNIDVASSKLKASLSETLNSFYPLSGRLVTTNNATLIHDFDQGVPFVEARVIGQELRHFLQPPKMEFLNCFLPREPMCLLPADDAPLLSVQLTTFDCGGIALGVSFHHRVCDGATTGIFLKSWTAIANPGRGISCEPDLLGASSAFPPRQELHNIPMTATNEVIRRGNPRRFVFDSNALSELRSMGRSAQVENPSRTEIVCAFIWQHAMKAAAETESLSWSSASSSSSSSSSSSPKPLRFAQEVNIRLRMGHPHLSENSVGNLTSTAFVTCDETSTFPELVVNLRKGVQGIDHEYLNNSSWVEQLVDYFIGEEEEQEENIGGFLAGSSLLRFGLSEVDLGFGKPIWTGMFGNARGDGHVFFPWHCSLVMLKDLGGDSKINGNATEAWITLDEDLMAALEQDPHFLKFASPNPPIVFP